MEKLELKTTTRIVEGKKVKHLRKEGLLPGVIFSKKSSQTGKGLINVQVKYNEFESVYSIAKETQLVTLKLEDNASKENKSIKTLIHEVQKCPIELKPIHVSFHKVDLTEKITTSIPVILIDVEDNELIKSGEGVVLHVIKEISVECLPTDIPDHFEISLKNVTEIGASISVAEGIKVDETKITVFDDPDEVVVTIAYPQQEEVEEETSVEDVEVIEKGKDEPEKATDKSASEPKAEEEENEPKEKE